MFEEIEEDDTQIRLRVPIVERVNQPDANEEDQHDPVMFENFAVVRTRRPRFVFCMRRDSKLCRKVKKIHHKQLLICRSNEYGIEVVLSYVWVDFTEDPTYLAWRTFKVHERKYTLCERAAAAVYFGIYKFNTRLKGNFTIVTDFKPLVALYTREGLGDRRQTLTSLLRFVADQLMIYNYRIIYRTKEQIRESLK